MAHAVRASCLLALLVGFVAPQALAGPDDIDLLAPLRGLHAELAAYRREPNDPGFDRAIRTAWRSFLRTRGGRMAQRADRLLDPKRWVLDDTGSVALAAKPDDIAEIVREVSALYSELGSARNGYDDVEDVDGRREKFEWDRRHRAPDADGLTPAGAAVLRLRRTLAWRRRNGVPVHRWELAEIDRLQRLEELEIAERIERVRAYEADRAAAHGAIDAEVERTREVLRSTEEGLAAQMATLRGWMADVQAVEEERLGALVAGMPEGEARTAAQQRMQRLRQGREEALRFDDPRSSRYGSLLRGDWLSIRKSILRAVEAAERTVEVELDVGDSDDHR